MRRVVITGMGAITPLGLNVEEFWNGLKEGRHGFGEITRFDASEYKAHLAGEVKGFVGKEFMDARQAKRNGTVLPVCGRSHKRSHRRGRS